jgi:hypothetical protein
VIWLLEIPWEKGKIAGAYGAIPKQPTANKPKSGKPKSNSQRQRPAANGQQPKSNSQGLRNSQVLRD